MISFDFIPFNFRQILKLIYIHNRVEWYRHTDVFLLKLIYRYNRQDIYSTIRIFFSLRYPRVWEYYAPIVKTALVNAEKSKLDFLLHKVLSKLQTYNVNTKDHILMLINIYHIFLFFGMCYRGLKFRSEARNLHLQLHKSLAMHLKSQHLLRMNGCYIELASIM